jgi:hypothetical protein
MTKILKIIFCFLLIAPLQGSYTAEIPKTTINADEVELYEILMSYRVAEGLGRIPLSNSLTIVAQTHCKDLVDNKPDIQKDCNAHSWSSKGKWSNCCYTEDHEQANCMWDKPKELTSYNGNGYEIAVGSSESDFADYVMTPKYALSAWQKSFHHNNVIINKDVWKDWKWGAVGIGIHKGFATVWFGAEADLDGEPNKVKE